MKQSTRRWLRGGISFALACATLWAVALAAPAESLGEAARTLALLRPTRAESALALLRFERGDAPPDNGALSFPAALALHVTPLLFAPRAEITSAWANGQTIPYGAPPRGEYASPGAADGALSFGPSAQDGA